MCEEKCGGVPGLSASFFCLYLDRYDHLSKYLSLSFGYVLGKVILCCYSFAGSSSVLVTDTLVEGP